MTTSTFSIGQYQLVSGQITQGQRVTLITPMGRSFPTVIGEELDQDTYGDFIEWMDEQTDELCQIFWISREGRRGSELLCIQLADDGTCGFRFLETDIIAEESEGRFVFG